MDVVELSDFGRRRQPLNTVIGISPYFVATLNVHLVQTYQSSRLIGEPVFSRPADSDHSSGHSDTSYIFYFRFSCFLVWVPFAEIMSAARLLLSPSRPSARTRVLARPRPSARACLPAHVRPSAGHTFLPADTPAHHDTALFASRTSLAQTSSSSGSALTTRRTQRRRRLRRRDDDGGDGDNATITRQRRCGDDDCATTATMWRRQRRNSGDDAATTAR